MNPEITTKVSVIEPLFSTVLKRRTIGVIFIGQHRSGKSTTAGHIYRDYERSFKSLSEHSNDYAFIFDSALSEKEKGMSIWLSYKELHLPNDNIRIINSPGNQKYIKEMINGEAFSDAAVLVVDATPENFERGIAEGGQTREHAILSFAFNKKQIIVAINMMDDGTVRYSEDRYNYIKNEMTKLLTNIGYEQKCFRFIPISGLKGDNLNTKSLNMTWWKGPSLLEMIDSFEKPERRIKTPLRFVVHKTIKIKNNETRAIGRVEYGFIKKDQMIAVAPSGIITKVDLIHKDRYSVGHAIAGDWVKLKLNISINDIKAGYIIGDQEIDPPNNCSIFTAHLIVIDNPKQSYK